MIEHTMLVVVLLTKEYWKKLGSMAEWEHISLLCARNPFRVMLCVLDDTFVPQMATENACNVEPEELAQSILRRARELIDSWKETHKKPFVGGAAPPDDRYQISLQPDDELPRWHEHLFVSNEPGDMLKKRLDVLKRRPGPRAPKIHPCETYIQRVEDRQAGVAVFCPGLSDDIASELATETETARYFDILRFPKAIELFCCPRGNVFYDPGAAEIASQLRRQMRTGQNRLHWLSVRWWDLGSYPKQNQWELLYAARLSDVRINVYLISSQSQDGDLFQYFAELSQVGKARHVFVVDSNELRSPATRKALVEHWLGAQTFTYWKKSLAASAQYLAGEVLRQLE